KYRNSTVWPVHSNSVNTVNQSEPNIHAVIYGGLKSSCRHLFDVKYPTTSLGGDAGANSRGIHVAARQNNLDIPMARMEVVRLIAIDERRHIDIVDDQVEVSVVVEIPVRTAVGKARFAETPLSGRIPKAQVARIPESVIAYRRRGDSICELFVVDSIS